MHREREMRGKLQRAQDRMVTGIHRRQHHPGASYQYGA